MLMDDHVTTNLSEVHVVIPDFYKAHYFVADDVKDKDGQRVVTTIDKEVLHHTLMTVQIMRDVVGH